jgi:nitrile hydratase beta subunit
MNGVHDMGGMQGFGPVAEESDEPVFHADWEARVLALVLAVGALGKWNIDAGRYAREIVPPADYLRMSYYEKWLQGLVTNMVDAGLVGRDEIARGTPDAAAGKATPVTPARIAALLSKGTPFDRGQAPPPRFSVGQRVRGRNIHPTGHTRLPRYARGRAGIVEVDHGAFVFPDSNARLDGERPQHLYSVRFAATELWGAGANARDSVTINLWDDHLEPA